MQYDISHLHKWLQCISLHFKQHTFHENKLLWLLWVSSEEKCLSVWSDMLTGTTQNWIGASSRLRLCDHKAKWGACGLCWRLFKTFLYTGIFEWKKKNNKIKKINMKNYYKTSIGHIMLCDQVYIIQIYHLLNAIPKLCVWRF